MTCEHLLGKERFKGIEGFKMPPAIERSDYVL